MAADDSSAPPNDFRDPYWTALADTTGQKLGLPVGLLASIVTRGERSNNNATNSLGTVSPFQITAKTQKLALGKYGIDAKLSPENAAEVAGLLLKDSLDRNGGDVNAAVGEYHGGLDRANWGPITKAYQGRVMLGQDAARTSALDNAFSKWMADNPASGPVTSTAAAPATAPDPLNDAFQRYLKTTGGAGPRVGADAIPSAAEDAGAPYVPPVAAAPTPPSGFMDKAIGAGEAGLQALTGAVGGTAGMIGGGALGLVQDVAALSRGEVSPQNLSTLAQAGQQALTYAPRTATGQQYGDAVQGAMQNMAPLMGHMGELGAISTLANPAIAQAGAAVRGAPAAVADALRVTPDAAPVAGVAADAAPAAAGSVAELAQTAKKAATGSDDAAKILAEQAAPNPETVKSAERLGVQDYLQPDHVTTNNAYRQVAGAIKSNPQSQVALAEAANLPKVAERASQLIDEIGGTNDLSALDTSIKTRMQDTHAQLSSAENGLYDKLRADMPSKTEAPAPNVLEFIRKRADDLGGEQNLSPLEKTIVKKLTPVGDSLDHLGPSARQQLADQGITGQKQPTYALLDDVRKDIGAAARMKGPFADSDTGLAKALYAQISRDQEATVSRAGLSTTFDAARQATIVRKGLEDDLASLFGKNLDHSLVAGSATGLRGAFASASAGDASGIGRLLSAVPQDMRQSVVASGLGTVFRKSATRGEMDFTGYAKWMDSLMRNRQAYAAVMSNLPLGARKQLMALYRVSKGISDSMQTRIKTGALNTIKAEMMGTDSLMSSLYSAAGKGVGNFVAHTALAHVPVVGRAASGMFSAVSSAIARGKAKPLVAVDALLASPEFAALAKAPAGTPARAAAVRKFAISPAFGQLMRKVGTPMTISERERWIVQAMQNTPNSDSNQRRPAMVLH